MEETRLWVSAAAGGNPVRENLLLLYQPRHETLRYRRLRTGALCLRGVRITFERNGRSAAAAIFSALRALTPVCAGGRR